VFLKGAGHKAHAPGRIRPVGQAAQHEKDDLILSILSANTGTNLAILCHLIPSLKYYSEDQAGVFTSRWFERCRARTMLTVLEIFRAP
jgi:hypothetical protein